MDFEREGVGRKEAIEEYKAIYRRISKKIHPDFFKSKGEDVHKEAEELFKDLESIKFTNGWQKPNGENADSIKEKIKELEEFEKRADEFVARNSAGNQENVSGGADDDSKADGDEKGADNNGQEEDMNGRAEGSTSNDGETEDSTQGKKEASSDGHSANDGEKQYGQDDAHTKRNQWTDDFSRGPSSKGGEGSDHDADKQGESINKEEWLGRFSGFYEGKENREKGANKDGEKSESSGGNEETEKTDAEKRAEKLERLKQNVELTRAAYARRISEILDKFSVIEKVLYHVKTTPENLAGTIDEYNQYQVALNALLKFQAESIRSKYDDISSKNLVMKTATDVGADDEMRELFMYYKNDEKIELYNARTKAKDDIRAKKKDNNELTWKDKVWETGTNVANWYRKLPPGKKAAASLGLFAVGLGAGFAGAASVATGVGVARFGQKIVGGAAAGVGAAEAQKNIRRMLDKRKVKKEEKRMFEELGKLGIDDIEGKLKILTGTLEEEIRTYDASLKREVRKAGNRKAIGWIVGTAIGASAIVQVVNGLGLNAGQTAKIGIPRASHLHGSSFIKPEIQGNIHNVETPGVEPGPAVGQVPGPGVAAAQVAEMPKGAEITIGKGSIEGNLIKHLTAQGVSKAEAGKMAHRMAVGFAKEHNLPKGAFSLVHEGTKIHLSPDGKHIIGIDGDKKLGWIEKDAGGHKRFSFASPEQREAAGIKTVAENHHSPEVPHAAPQNVPGHAPTESPQPAGTVESGNADNVTYRSMPEALRSGVNEIDSRFGLSDRVAYDLDEYRRITEEMKAVRIDSRFGAEDKLFAPSHDFSESRDLPELRVQLADIDNRLNSPDLDAESPIKDDLIEQKISLESTIKLQEERDIALDGLRERQALCLKKIASGLRKAMFDGDDKISGNPQQIANMVARDYLNDPVAAGRGGKIIGIYQSLMKLPGGEAFAPKSEERMDVWTRRIIIALMKSKGLKFY